MQSLSECNVTNWSDVLIFLWQNGPGRNLKWQKHTENKHAKFTLVQCNLVEWS